MHFSARQDENTSFCKLKSGVDLTHTGRIIIFLEVVLSLVCLLEHINEKYDPYMARLKRKIVCWREIVDMRLRLMKLLNVIT